jgi:putative phosphoribosyl transferase
MRLPFRDRREAGVILAKKLEHYRDAPDLLILALPRGGVPVGFELAQHLHAPLDVFLVRKLGVPGHEELAFGAIASGGVRVLSDDLIDHLGLSRILIDSVTQREQQELSRREQLYRSGPGPDLRNRIVILTDDGLATGATMLAATRAARAQQPRKLIVAVPVAAPQTCEEFRQEADEIVCAATPEPFRAVGLWFEDFTQTTDEEVAELLQNAQQFARSPLP